MVFVNPPIVATGDFVTANLWNTYIRANGLHVRGLLPDASTVGHTLVATSTTTAAFGQVGGIGIAASAITSSHIVDGTILGGDIAASTIAGSNIANATIPDSALALAKVQAATTIFSTFSSVGGTGKNGMYEVSPASDGPVSGHTYYCLQVVEQNQPTGYLWQIAQEINDPNEIYVRIIQAGGGTTWRKLWHAGNDGTGSGLDAGSVIGKVPTVTPTASAIPVADGSGKLDSWITIGGSGASVPSGLIAAFETAGAIAAGWARYTPADGRMLVGAGTAFSTTWTEATNYGSAWSHSHATTWSSHNHTSSALGVGGTLGNNTASGQSAGTGTSRADDPHTHSISALDVTGATDNGGGGGSSADAWTIPSRAIVWAAKS